MTFCLFRKNVVSFFPFFFHNLALVFLLSLIDYYFTQTITAICKVLASAFKYQ